jgi:hypothetical protein
LDSFDDRYLGTKTSDPTLDNDGNALVSGALYFSTTQNVMKVYDGASWITATSAGATSLLRFRYVATSGQTTFSGVDAASATLTYTVNNIAVHRNGVTLDTSEYTASNGTSVVLGVAAGTGDVIDIVAFKSFTVADTYSKAEVDGFTVKLTGAQTVAGVKTFSSQPVMSAGVSLGSNGQIVFPATQNASSDANTLDDYEEGTWTPTLSAIGSAPSVTHVFRAGVYVKIGRQVTLYARIQWSAFSGGSGSVIVQGLPFTGSNDSDETGGAVGLALSWNTTPQQVQVDGASTNVYVMRNTANSNSQVADVGATGYLFFTINYLV